MKKTIILYDLIAREYWACNEIKKCMEEKGDMAEIYSLNFEFYKALKSLKKQKTDVLIIPSCYSAADYERVVMPFKVYNLDLVVICMHSEQLGYEDSEIDLIAYDKEAQNTMYHLSWGCYFTKLLIVSGVSRELILEKGNLRLQEIYSNKERFNRESLANQYKLDKNKKWIIYCDSGTFLYYQMINKKKKPLNWIGIELEDRVYQQFADTFESTVKIFNSLPDVFFEKYELIYRAHPGINDIDIDFLDSRIKLIREYTVYTWFEHVEYNIVLMSTSIFESDAMGVKSFILSPVYLEKNIVGLSNFTKVEDQEGVEKILLDDMNENIISNVSQMYMGIPSPTMIDEFVYEINDIIVKGTKTQSSEGISINNKKKTTSLVVDVAVRAFHFLGILKYIKHPKRFEMNKYEHPIFSDKYISKK